MDGLVMVIVVVVLAATGQFKVFEQYFDETNTKAEVIAPDILSQTDIATG